MNTDNLEKPSKVNGIINFTTNGIEGADKSGADEMRHTAEKFFGANPSIKKYDEDGQVLSEVKFKTYRAGDKIAQFFKDFKNQKI